MIDQHTGSQTFRSYADFNKLRSKLSENMSKNEDTSSKPCLTIGDLFSRHEPFKDFESRILVNIKEYDRQSFNNLDSLIMSVTQRPMQIQMTLSEYSKQMRKLLDLQKPENHQKREDKKETKLEESTIEFLIEDVEKVEQENELIKKEVKVMERIMNEANGKIFLKPYISMIIEQNPDPEQSISPKFVFQSIVDEISYDNGLKKVEEKQLIAYTYEMTMSFKNNQDDSGDDIKE